MSIKGFNISGTTYKVDYPELDNLPQINGNTLTGDKDTAALGLKQVAGVAYGIATSAEIDALYQAGMIVTVGVNADGALQPKTACTLIKRESATKHLFSATGKTKVVWAECNNNTWTKGVFDYATSANMPQPATVTPHDLGIASVGSQYNKYALEDHTHAMPSAEDVGAIPDPTTKSSGQVLTYNGYSWEARTPSGGGGGDITVDSELSSTSENPVQNKVVKAAVDAKYSKPSGGIPKSDLAAAVQTSLGKADTALQSAPVTSVNGQTGAVTINVPSLAGYQTEAITDTGGYYTTDTVEGALQEIGAKLASKIGKDDGAVMVMMTASGNTVTCLKGFSWIYTLFASQQKTYFALVKSQTDYQMFNIDRVDAGNAAIYLSSIVGGVLSQIVLTPSGSNSMTGTLSTIDLNLQSASGVSF